MTDSWDYNLSMKDLDILIEECTNEINNSNRELSLLIVRRKILQNKIKEWQMEKEWLTMLKNGEKIDKLIDITPQQTIKTVNKKYSELMNKFKDLNFEDPEVERARIERDKKRTPKKDSKERTQPLKNIIPLKKR